MADQLCYICGDVGYAELIVTCTKCKVVREHLYCMPNRNDDEVPNSWLCGNCTLDGAKSPDGSGLQVQPKMPRHAKIGKVKFLPTEEVMKLSSGGINAPSKLNTTFAPQKKSNFRKVFESSMPRPLFQASKESQERSPLMPSKTCGLKKQALATCLPPMPVGPVQTLKKVKADTLACTSSVSRHGCPVTKTGKEVPSPSNKLQDTQKQRKDALFTHEVYAYRDNKGKQVPSPSIKLQDTQKQRKDAMFTHEDYAYRDNTGKNVPSPSKQKKDGSCKYQIHPSHDNKAKEVLSPFTKLEDTQKEKDTLFTHQIHAYHDKKGKEAPSPSTKLEDVQKNLKDALMIQEIHAYRDYFPSLHASWKGGFHFVGTRMAGEFYDGFLAKPPCVVYGRVYELSRKIPPILQVKLVSRSDIWNDLFHDECPDLADVALYFFPCNIERSRKNNSFLFELMEREDLLIRSLVDGAEMVLFTCRQLDRLSQYVINMFNPEYLIFGVFREIKDDKSPFPVLHYGPAVSSVESNSKVPLLEFMPKKTGKHDEDNVVKREIDIEGGKTAGKSPAANDVDSTIQRLLLEFGSQKPKESDDNTSNMNAQKRDEERTPIASTDSCSLSASKVKTEHSSDTKAEGSEGIKRLETERCLKTAAPTFSISGSQSTSEQDVPKRVAEKYLQIFNAGIKKERR
ncbi:hypothetical protein IC575_029844 [Cucumis melo]|uniref:Uncharacterized protein LOC103491456 n=1 Tax=Cucumis melo TaxID=3656 RepID=A0A1S3BMJ2_CUCME|nr:uncharacterized protein LOC103491456 [Cucumis melo]